MCYCEGVKVGRNDNDDVIVIFSKKIFSEEKPIPVAFDISYFSLPVKDSKKTLKIFQEVSESINYLSPIMYELSEKSLSLLKR